MRAGTTFHDIQEVHATELEEPDGWIRIPLGDATRGYLRTYFIQLAILSCHQVMAPTTVVQQA